MINDVSFSVIIPAYNVKSYVECAVQSVISQIQANDEVIVIDDGSDDGTSEILLRYSALGLIEYRKIENSGQGIARNLGVSLASKDYIYFFDADDILDQSALLFLRSEVKRVNLPDILFFEGKSFGSSVPVSDGSSKYARSFGVDSASKEVFFNMILKHGEISCSPCLYVSKRSIWNNNHLSFKSLYHEDQEIFMKLLLCCESFSVQNKCLFLRRERVGSTMRQAKSPKHSLGYEGVVITTIELIESCKSESLAVQKVLRRRLSMLAVAYIKTCYQARTSVNIKCVTSTLFHGRSIKYRIGAVGLFLLYKVRQIRNLIFNIYS